jgi:hypothetical protein
METLDLFGFDPDENQASPINPPPERPMLKLRRKRKGARHVSDGFARIHNFIYE